MTSSAPRRRASRAAAALTTWDKVLIPPRSHGASAKASDGWPRLSVTAVMVRDASPAPSPVADQGPRWVIVTVAVGPTARHSRPRVSTSFRTASPGVDQPAWASATRPRHWSRDGFPMAIAWAEQAKGSRWPSRSTTLAAPGGRLRRGGVGTLTDDLQVFAHLITHPAIRDQFPPGTRVPTTGCARARRTPSDGPSGRA